MPKKSGSWTLSEWRIPLCDLDYNSAEEVAVAEVLRRRWLTMGAEVEAFESEFSESCGAKHAISVCNGTAALHVAMLALEMRPDDEIIQPAINFVAAANVTTAIGATPVFADIVSLEEPRIDPGQVQNLLTQRTKAVVTMHYGGYLDGIGDIFEICRKNHLTLIEDACHAVGANFTGSEKSELSGKAAGNLGDIACFSFFSNKNLAVGEGGMITTASDDVARKARLFRSHGMTTLTWDRHRGHASTYDVLCHGYNYRPDEIRAALGRVQLRKLGTNNLRRADLARLYQSRLAELPGWVTVFGGSRSGSSHHLMVAVAPDERARSLASQSLKRALIQTSLHYPCITDFTAFEKFHHGSLENSRTFARRAITLPLYPGMSSSQVEETCAVIQQSCS
jgi:dTDP-4-amino-4,6-dideoxygalactose transaminase